MSNGNQQPPAKPDDPLVVAALYFFDPVPIGTHGAEEWTMQGVAQNQYHGRSRAEMIPAGARITYKAGERFEQITVPWANIRSITEIPLSRLEKTTRDVYDRCQKEIRR